MHKARLHSHAHTHTHTEDPTGLLWLVHRAKIELFSPTLGLAHGFMLFRILWLTQFTLIIQFGVIGARSIIPPILLWLRHFFLFFFFFFLNTFYCIVQRRKIGNAEIEAWSGWSGRILTQCSRHSMVWAHICAFWEPINRLAHWWQNVNKRKRQEEGEKWKKVGARKFVTWRQFFCTGQTKKQQQQSHYSSNHIIIRSQ